MNELSIPSSSGTHYNAFIPPHSHIRGGIMNDGAGFEFICKNFKILKLFFSLSAFDQCLEGRGDIMRAEVCVPQLVMCETNIPTNKNKKFKYIERKNKILRTYERGTTSRVYLAFSLVLCPFDLLAVVPTIPRNYRSHTLIHTPLINSKKGTHGGKKDQKSPSK